MKNYRIIYLDAFTSEPFCGNPCAVVPQAGGLTDSQMQKIAMETNLSETAFVFPSAEADVKVRYFMPAREIPFAGHPTIATAYLLAQEGIFNTSEPVSTVEFEFNVGVLPVEIHWDQSKKPVKIVMNQKRPIFGDTVDPAGLKDCLSLDLEAFMDRVPARVVNAGVPFLIVPLRSLDDLKKARMNRPALADVLEPLGVDGAYLFCLGGVDPDSDTHGRLFSPSGFSEDPFTGSAVGCMGAYVVHNNLCSSQMLTAEQGHLIGRPGKGVVEVGGRAGNIESIRVGGSAVRTLEGVIPVS